MSFLVLLDNYVLLDMENTRYPITFPITFVIVKQGQSCSVLYLPNE